MANEARQARALIHAALLVLLTAAPAQAQAVRGRVLTRPDSALAGALVVLVDDAGVRRAGSLTADDGRFRVVAPGPGQYRVRLERIGYRTTESPRLELFAGEDVHYDLVAAAEPVPLHGLTVRGERRCQVRPADGLQVHTLWEEARKALNATDWAEGTSAFGYRIRRYERDLDLQTHRILRETSRSSAGFGERPFASPPPESLARFGFVQPEPEGRVFYAPDARVLLSDRFLDTHCFRLNRGDASRAGLAGLDFEPIGDSGLPDVRGTLWIDTATAELTEITYSYTRLERSIPRGLAQGRLFFERTPTGVWIVRRWWVRMPMLGRSGGRESVIGIREDGGEVVEIVAVGGDPGRSVAAAAIEGFVRDSTTVGPLGEAAVYLSGTQHSTTAGPDGHFLLTDLPEGSYTISFTHPRLDAMGAGWSSLPIDTRSGDTARVELWVPSATTIASSVCPEDVWREGALVAGVLRSEAGAPVPRARLEVSYRDYSRAGGTLREARGQTSAVTDSQGRYRVCGVPRGVSLTVAPAERRSGRIDPMVFEVPDAPVIVLDLSLRSAALPAPGEAVPLEPVVVTARSAQEEAALRRGSRASVLTRAEIEPLLARASTVPHLVRAMNIPGLTVRDDIEVQSGAFGIQVRGTCIQSGRVRTGGDQCLMVAVFLDGARMVEPHVQLAHLNPDDVESIEFIPVTESMARYGRLAEHGALLIRTVQRGR